MEEETAKFKWLLIVLIAFVISGCYSYSELKYLVVGKTAEGTVKQAYTVQERGRRFRTREVLVVEYAYKGEDGTLTTAKDRFSGGTEPPAAGKPVTLEYIPGKEDSARLAGHRNWVAVMIFLACAAGTGWFVVRIWREGTEDTRKKTAAKKQMARR